MEKTLRQYEALNWASSFLKEYGREEHIATLLLQHHLQVDRVTFFREMQAMVSAEMFAAYAKDIEAHAKTGVPAQHLMGGAPFYGNDFFVNEHVLIPRFETEELVEHASDYLQAQTDRKGLVVVDIGTGSGVIAITLKKLFPELIVYATDISPQALQVAKKNARRLEVDVHFRQGNFLMPLLNEKIHPAIILSNPPYIGESEKETLADTVKNFEPPTALYADKDGLQAYHVILEQMTNLTSGDLRALFFEIGETQAEAVREMMGAVLPGATVEVIQDMNRKDRIIAKRY